MNMWLVFKFSTLDVISSYEKRKKKREIFFMLDNKVTEWETSEMTRSDNHNTGL